MGAAAVEKQRALAEAAAAVELASAKVQEAEELRSSGDAGLEAAALRKERIEAVHRDTFVPIRDGSATGAEAFAAVEVLVQLGKELTFDDSLLASISSALVKEAGSRGAFDEVVLSQFDAELVRCIGNLDEQISEGQPGKAACLRAVEAARAGQQAAETARVEREEELAAARARAAEGRAAAGAAQEALGQAELELALAVAKLERAQAGLETLRAAALTAFRELNSPAAAVATAVGKTEATPEAAEQAIQDAAVAKSEEAKHGIQGAAIAVAAALFGA